MTVAAGNGLRPRVRRGPKALRCGAAFVFQRQEVNNRKHVATLIGRAVRT